jgi:hypothetical protein
MVTSYEHPSVTYYRKLLERQLKPGVGDSIARSALPTVLVNKCRVHLVARYDTEQLRGAFARYCRNQMTAGSLREEVQTDAVLERLRPRVQLKVVPRGFCVSYTRGRKQEGLCGAERWWHKHSLGYTVLPSGAGCRSKRSSASIFPSTC